MKKIRRNSKEFKIVLANMTNIEMCGGDDYNMTPSQLAVQTMKCDWFEMFRNSDGSHYIRGAKAGWNVR